MLNLEIKKTKFSFFFISIIDEKMWNIIRCLYKVIHKISFCHGLDKELKTLLQKNKNVIRKLGNNKYNIYDCFLNHHIT